MNKEQLAKLAGCLEEMGYGIISFSCDFDVGKGPPATALLKEFRVYSVASVDRVLGAVAQEYRSQQNPQSP